MRIYLCNVMLEGCKTIDERFPVPDFFVEKKIAFVVSLMIYGIYAVSKCIAVYSRIFMK